MIDQNDSFQSEPERPLSLSGFELLLAQYKSAVYERIYVHFVDPLNKQGYVKKLFNK